MKKLIIFIMLILCSVSVFAEFNLPTLWLYNQQNGSSLDQNGNGIVDICDTSISGGNSTGSSSGGNLTMSDLTSALSAYINVTRWAANGNWTSDRPNYINTTSWSSLISTYVNSTTNNAILLNYINTTTWTSRIATYINSTTLNPILSNYLNYSTINASIAAALVTIDFLPSSYTIVTGINISNNLTAMQTYDNNAFNITEEAGNPGVNIILNFTTVTSSIDRIAIRTRYTGVDTVYVQLWSYTSNAWENYGNGITQQGQLSFQELVIGDPAEHVSNNKSALRLLTTDNGNTNYELDIDLAVLARGAHVSTANDHDSLSGRNMYNTNHPLYASAITSIGNWSSNRPDYINTTIWSSLISTYINNTEILNNAALNNYIRNSIDANGNWSADKPLYLPLSGGVMTGAINMSIQNITSVNCFTGYTGGKICFI